MLKNRYSKQRELIQEFLNENRQHPTADEVYLSVRKALPDISLGTVYRNLNQLAESGIIRRVSVGDGKDRYDYNTAFHGHFLCRSCGMIYDVALPEPDAESAEAFGRTDSAEVIFRGTCRNCLKNNICADNTAAENGI